MGDNIPEIAVELRTLLLEYFDQNARDLPWRRTSDPYSIWVSEIMLQQTRVDTVIDYFERFIERFPTLDDLADAKEEEVLALWSGLGYYRRARLLHSGVKEAREHYGQVPRAAADRLRLPGIGRYTAGAIGSIAFGLEEPIVDGNVARVLSRLFAIDAPIGSANSDKKLWALAAMLVMGERPGDLNQALMEFGALVCTPKNASCDTCSLKRLCRAHSEERVGELPRPRIRRAPKKVRLTAVVATCGKRLALVQAKGALFGGLFGCPSLEGTGRDVARQALQEAGLQARLEKAACGALKHQLTHRSLEVEVWRAKAAKEQPGSEVRFLEERELSQLGVSTLTRKILSAALRPPASVL